jgi:hypothetical protein
MAIIHHVRSYFQKPMVRIRVDDHIRTIVVLTGGKLIEIYFPQFSFCNLHSIMTHIRHGKKVSIFSSGDVCHVYCAFL